jgi:primosomal protein N' (replication factor Y)
VGESCCQVLLTSPPFAALTYLQPARFPDLAVGQRVLVPMGRSLRLGLVTALSVAPPEGVALKPVFWPLEPRPLLDADYLALAGELSARQMVPVGRILETLLPLRLRTPQVRFCVPGEKGRAALSPRRLAALPEAEQDRLAGLFAQGRMVVRSQLPDTAEDCVRLASDPPWRVRPGALRQLAVLELLLERGPQPRERVVSALGPGTAAILDTLSRHGLVHLGPLDEDPALPGDGLTPDSLAADDPGSGASDASAQACAPGRVCTPEQATALEELFSALDSRRAETRLLFGITGSGKTHVYLELAARCLAAGRSALILAPEIALALKLWREASRRFPDRAVIFHHGSQSPSRRERTFSELAWGRGGTREPVLVVGSRSALFLPLPDLGLVVLDEEHDESYKQEERLSYQAKEVGYFRASRAGALLVLGSATPDVKTFYAAQSGAIPMHSLTRRAGGASSPDIELVTLSAKNLQEQPFAPESLESLKAVLKAGDQAMIMLNRRGYAPMMYCLECGKASEREAVYRCPECNVGMTFHKTRERLVCHYCGLVHPYPSPCVRCGGMSFLPLGGGTQHLEETLEGLVPAGTEVVRLDRDSTRRQERLEDILDRFARGQAQVMVGTQMLSKGHHFPGVTLVVVADGDLGLNLPDYRASERTFQLLVQAAGRSGRGERPGRVLIQTRNPGHAFWDFVVRGDYEGFYAREIELRRKYAYPPFVKLGLLRFSYPADWEGGAMVLGQAAKAVREAARELSATVLGPAPAPLSRLRGRNRFHCLVKAQRWPTVRELYARVAGLAPRGGDFRVQLDLDPLNML